MLVRATAVLERRGGYYDCFIENEVQERIECCQVSKREKDFKVDNYWGIALFIFYLSGAIKLGIIIVVVLIIGLILFQVAKKSFNRNRKGR